VLKITMTDWVVFALQRELDGEIAMSTKYEDPKLVPTSVLIERLKELADAIAKGNRDELTMRIPAEVDRDADIVLAEAAKRLEYFRVRYGLNNAA
jgi:hypothetical protein